MSDLATYNIHKGDVTSRTYVQISLSKDAVRVLMSPIRTEAQYYTKTDVLSINIQHDII